MKYTVFQVNIGLFAAKCALNAAKRFANSCKTQCYLLQNAMLTHAKRSANSYKTQV